MFMSPWLNVASFRKRGCLDPFLHFWPLICTKNLSIFVNKQIIYSVYLGQNIYLSLNYYIWYFLYSRNKLTSWSIWPGNENDILLRVLRNLLSDSRRNRFNLNLLILEKKNEIDILLKLRRILESNQQICASKILQPTA